jgi:hypothetical protein
MEFKSLKNIETSFRQIRFFGIVFVCLCAGIVGYSLFSAYNFAERQKGRKAMYSTAANRSCLPSRRTCRKTVPSKRGNT